jgi:hypothetical protein
VEVSLAWCWVPPIWATALFTPRMIVLFSAFILGSASKFFASPYNKQRESGRMSIPVSLSISNSPCCQILPICCDPMSLARMPMCHSVFSLP